MPPSLSRVDFYHLFLDAEGQNHRHKAEGMLKAPEFISVDRYPVL